MSAENFGQRLRRLRLERGFTVQQVAEAIDVTHSIVRRAENNEHQIRAHRLPDLARWLGVTIDYLLTGDDRDSALRRAILVGAPREQLLALVSHVDARAVAKRKCLRCSSPFESTHAGNRICVECREAIAMEGRVR